MRLAGRAGMLGLAARTAAGALWAKASLAAAGLFLVVVLVAGAGAAAIPLGAAACTNPAEAAGTVRGAPKRFAGFYLAAAKRYRLGERGPAILAAIHRVETDFGRLNGVTSSAGAIGHMQFLPATWSAYGVDANGDGKKDPYDPADAIHGAANYLHASGAPRDWYRAIFAYNHADWYVAEILEHAKRFGDVGEIADATTLECEGGGEGGLAELGEAIRLTAPRAYKTLPARYMAYGSPQQVDARIYANAIWILERYELRVTAARETGHATHGAGLALDMVPPEAGGGVGAWRRSAERLARDLGWSPGCGRSGTEPACDLVPAIYGVFYNGYPSHGDPVHCSGGCPAHIHVSWMASTIAAAGLVPPADWVMVFPSPGVSR